MVPCDFNAFLETNRVVSCHQHPLSLLEDACSKDCGGCGAISAVDVGIIG